MLAKDGSKNIVGEYGNALPDLKMKYWLSIIDNNRPRWIIMLLNIDPFLAFGIDIIRLRTINIGRIYAINHISMGVIQL